MNKEEMRKAFEDWLVNEYGRGVFGTGLNDGGEYLDIYTRFMLEAWQVRQPEIDQLKAEIVDLKNALYECEQGEK